MKASRRQLLGGSGAEEQEQEQQEEGALPGLALTAAPGEQEVYFLDAAPNKRAKAAVYNAVLKITREELHDGAFKTRLGSKRALNKCKAPEDVRTWAEGMRLTHEKRNLWQMGAPEIMHLTVDDRGDFLYGTPKNKTHALELVRGLWANGDQIRQYADPDYVEHFEAYGAPVSLVSITART
ncbi:hypothetical protein JKP88DRAFT_289785 [Tribonema minus]|uniref:Uncharacterized protein n=1 Tax=Tribonema minus TaxID=303371 RepID=A0A836CFL6_9STRA|nr:hypothetical protein JKP88DRAFT_289785 [Tribonema minus]